MSGDWNEQMERRTEGLVPGYVGNNDTAAPAAAVTGDLEQIVTGLAAGRPAANAYRGWYFSSDTGALEHSDGAAWAAPSGTSVPIPSNPAAPATATVTPDPVTGAGHIEVIETPTEQTVLAFKLPGDAFPRWIFTTTGEWYSGDGAHDPYNDESGGFYYDAATKRLKLTGNSGVNVVASLWQTTGEIHFTNLPTVDPAVVGQLWNNAGVLTVSAG